MNSRMAQVDGSSYHLPTGRLAPLIDPNKTPLVFVACGSFSPVTLLHLRCFEMARDQAHQHTNFQVVGGYLSPVSDDYKKPGLAPGHHRYNMCRLACIKASDWIMVDDWEVSQPAYSKTADVLDHFHHELNEKLGGAEIAERDPESGELVMTGQRKKIRIMLLAGSDLIQTMSEPGVWDEKDLHHILGAFGCFVVERAESEIDQSIFSSSSVHSRSPLALYRNNIVMVPQMVRNDVSSTKVRLFLRRGMSVMYLVPTAVARYIERYGLYLNQKYHGELSSSPSNNTSSTSVNIVRQQSQLRETVDVAQDTDSDDVDDAQLDSLLKQQSDRQ